MSALRATGFITVASCPADRRTVTVAGTQYWAGTDFVAGTLVNTVADVAKSLAACLNTNTYVFATYSGAVVNITARATGAVGNALTLASDTPALVVSGPTLVGGADDIIQINVV